MRATKATFMAGLLLSTAPASATGSLFARLVDASSKSDKQALSTILRSQVLSTSSATLAPGNRTNGGELAHGVSATPLIEKLLGCAVERWRDVGGEQGSAFILWHCPEKRVPDNDCYFYSYRAELLDPRHHPPNLYIGETPSWDNERCGLRHVAPPPPPPPRLKARTNNPIRRASAFRPSGDREWYNRKLCPSIIA